MNGLENRAEFRSDAEEQRAIEGRIELRRLSSSAILAGIFLTLIWVVYFYDRFFDLHLAQYGLHPRHIDGLIGILAAPFIHGDLNHLASNSLPAFLLMAGIIYFYRGISYQVLLIIWIATGMSVWLFGRANFHIGASGMVYGMASFMAISGMLRGDNRLLAVSFLTIFLYGGMVWGVLPLFRHISWESHLCGAITGIVCAVAYRGQGPPKPIYLTPDEEEEPNPEPGSVTVTHNTAHTEAGIVHHTANAPVRIIYIVVPPKKEEISGGNGKSAE
jgi:membrane associated rhomboid family serine protease